VVEDMSIRGARMLEPVFESQRGRQGRLSVQTSPILFRSPAEMVYLAVYFASIAPYIIVFLPAS
jgi:transaldolase